MCIGWATMDVLMCTASIWHMATISVDRYCSIRFPLRYRRTKSPVFVVVKIAFVWIVSIGICSFLAVEGLLNASNVFHDGQCVPALPEFVIYGSIFAFYVPLLVMFVTYALTVRTLSRNVTNWKHQLRQHSSTAYRLAQSPTIRSLSVCSECNELNHPVSQTSHECRTSNISITAPASVGFIEKCVQEGNFAGSQISHGDDRKALYGALSMPELTLIATAGRLSSVDEHVRYTVSHPALTAPATTTVKHNNKYNDNKDYDETIERQRPQPLRQNDHQQTRPPLSDSCRRCHVTADDQSQTQINSTVNTHESCGVDVEPHHDDDVSPQRQQTSDDSKPAPLRVVPGHEARRLPAKAADRDQSISGSTKRTKRKATRVLGVMFVVFVVLWTPFFVLNLLSAVCPQCIHSVAPVVWTVLVWLGWISSLANPIIYTSFSPAFRAAFRRLLTCQGRRAASLAKYRQQLWTSLQRRHQSPLSSM